MPLTQVGRDLALQAAVTTVTLTPAATLYLGLFSGAPGDAGSSFSNELSGNGYARQACATSLSSHVVGNTGTVTFTASGGSWSTATFAGLFDAASAGSLRGYAELSQSGATFFLEAAQVGNPGSGHAVNDVLTLAGGTFTTAAAITVDAVATVNSVAGVITKFHVSNAGTYSVAPVGSQTTSSSGSGTGATFTGIYASPPQAFTLNNGDNVSIAPGTLAFGAA